MCVYWVQKRDMGLDRIGCGAEREYFEPKANREELAKRMFSLIAWKEKGGEHMDISHIKINNDEEKKE